MSSAMGKSDYHGNHHISKHHLGKAIRNNARITGFVKDVRNMVGMDASKYKTKKEMIL